MQLLSHQKVIWSTNFKIFGDSNFRFIAHTRSTSPGRKEGRSRHGRQEVLVVLRSDLIESSAEAGVGWLEGARWTRQLRRRVCQLKERCEMLKRICVNYLYIVL